MIYYYDIMVLYSEEYIGRDVIVWTGGGSWIKSCHMSLRQRANAFNAINLFSRNHSDNAVIIFLWKSMELAHPNHHRVVYQSDQPHQTMRVLFTY